MVGLDTLEKNSKQVCSLVITLFIILFGIFSLLATSPLMLKGCKFRPKYIWYLRPCVFNSYDSRDCYTMIYYIPINVICLDTVDFTECDPMLRITILWFSESISSLSETDDVVHNVFSIHNAWGIVTSFISHRTKSVPIYKMKPTVTCRGSDYLSALHSGSGLRSSRPQRA